MRNKDIADLLEHCSRESGCGLYDKWHNGCPGQRNLLNEAAELIRDSSSTCKKCNNYSLEEVAQLLCDMYGDDCACNYNGNDEWLPFVCDHCDECPIPAEHLACWKQYLIHLHEKERILTSGKHGVETVSTDIENRNGRAGT